MIIGIRRKKGIEVSMTELEKKKLKEAKKIPLTPAEERFLAEYIKTGNLSQSVKKSGYQGSGSALLNQPNIQARIKKIMRKLEKQTMATATEVMEYFTAVMRGEIADQFGLEASIADRTKAAQELAKRTVDIENREKGKADSMVEIKLNWRR